MTSDKTLSIAVTSMNRAKIAAVYEVAKDVLDDFPTVFGVAARSGVSETPIGNIEAINGCINRLEDAKAENPAADLFVSIEGAIDFNDFGAFVYSWVVIDQRTPPRRAFGSSAKVQLPPALALAAERGQSLADLTTRLYGTDKNVREIGTNGIVTDGAFTRSHEFESALRCAFGYLLNERNYAGRDVG